MPRALTVLLALPPAPASGAPSPQDNERKQKSTPKETPEELQECEAVFADF